MLRAEREVFVAIIRQTAALTVYAAAEPQPRFTWFNGSTSLTASSHGKVDITTASHGGPEAWQTLFRHSSTLTLSDVDVWDLTEYRVVVSNDYGSNQTSLRLIEASK